MIYLFHNLKTKSCKKINKNKTIYFYKEKKNIFRPHPRTRSIKSVILWCHSTTRRSVDKMDGVFWMDSTIRDSMKPKLSLTMIIGRRMWENLTFQGYYHFFCPPYKGILKGSVFAKNNDFFLNEKPKLLIFQQIYLQVTSPRWAVSISDFRLLTVIGRGSYAKVFASEKFEFFIET